MIGDIINSAASIFNADRANSANRAMQAKQFEQTKMLMQRGHQYEVEDMKKAGLNPILSAGGSGASGSAPNPIPTVVPDIRLPTFTEVVGLDLERQRVKNQTEMVNVAKQQAGADIPKKLAETGLKKAETRLKNKGLLKADLEGKAVKGLDWMFQRLKEMYQQETKQTPIQNNSSSGGEIYHD